MTAESATMRSFREVDLGVEEWGRMRDEMLAGKEAKELEGGGGGGGGGAGKSGKKGESVGVAEEDEKGSFGF